MDSVSFRCSRMGWASSGIIIGGFSIGSFCFFFAKVEPHFYSKMDNGRRCGICLPLSRDERRCDDDLFNILTVFV